MRIQLYFVLSCFFGLSLYGQEKINADSIVSTFIERYEKAAREVIYLQTSKDIYETGEDLWFKAYQVDRANHYLSAESQTLYLQVVSKSDSVVWQEKYPLFNGIAHGHVFLSDKLRNGTYNLEAYTSSSFFNDSCALNSTRAFEVIDNITNREIIPQKDSITNFRLDFFPEGGNIVNGIPSSVAFKATDGRSNPIDIIGGLYENDSLLRHIESTHDGMGQFSFIPQMENNYQVRLNTGQSFVLPKIHAEGLSMHLIQQCEEFLEFMVYQNNGALKQRVFILGQMGGVPRCLGKGVLQDSLRIKIPINKTDFLVQGIAEFTLFDELEKPIAERLVFINPNKELHITAKFDKLIYKSKDKVELKIKVTDFEGNPAQAHLGVSVFDRAYSHNSYPINIRTHYLLSSQLVGNIHNPYYYFNKENSNRLEALDLLLLTQGWRRYTWGYQRDTHFGTTLLNDSIKGVQRIRDKKLRGTEQMVKVFNPKDETAFVWVDSLERFNIAPDVMYQLREGYLYLKPLLDADKKIKLEVEDPFIAINQTRKLKTSFSPFVDMNYIKDIPFEQSLLAKQSGTILLEEIIVTGKSHKPIRDKYMGRLDSLAQVNLGPWACECNKQPPLFLQNYRTGYDHHDHPGGRYEGKKIPPVEGETYTLIKYEPAGVDGEWILTDKKTIIYHGPEYSDEDLLRMNNLWRVKGYYGARDFYMPDELDIRSPLPDTRNTLLWNPMVITDEKGEATLELYTSDLNTGFIGRIEGIGNDGLLGATTCEMNVIRNSSNE